MDLDSYGQYPRFNISTIYNLDDYEEQSRKIKIPLYLHQKLDVKKMKDLEESDIIFYKEDDPRFEPGENINGFFTKVGFLAEEPGYGKSLTILARIAAEPKLKIKPNTERIYITTQNSMFFQEAPKRKYLKTNVIVVPFKIITQWISYLEDYTSLTFAALQSKKDFEFEDDDACFDFFKKHKVVLITDTMYRNLKSTFIDSVIISRLVIDEADTIKVPKTKTTKNSFFNAVFTWFVTASVSNLMNTAAWRSKGVMYEISYLLKGYPLNKKTVQRTVIIRNDEKTLAASITLPEPSTFRYVVENPIVLNIVQGLISDDILTMLNSGSEEEALNHLKFENSTEEGIVKLLAENLLNELSNLKLERTRRQGTIYATAKYKEETLEDINKQIKECKKKIDVLTERINEHLNEDLCVICYEQFTRFKMITKCCNSVVCPNCLTQHLHVKNICFNCREPMSLDDVVQIDLEAKVESKKKKKHKTQLKTKIECLGDILSKNNDEVRKILIFSDYDESYGEIEKLLKKNDIPIFKLTGKITKKIDEFRNSSQTEVLFLNAHYIGAGVNLEFCTDIIQWHKVPDNRQKQIIGRGQRIGRTTPLRVWEIFYQNET